MLLFPGHLYPALLCGVGLSALHTERGYAVYDIPDVRFCVAAEQQWAIFVLFFDFFKDVALQLQSFLFH